MALFPCRRITIPQHTVPSTVCVSFGCWSALPAGMQQLSATHKQQPCAASIQQQAQRANIRAAVTATTACQQEAQISRRDALVASLLACSSFCATPPAMASVPEVAAAGQWGLPFSLPAPPEPVRFPRKALNLRFAVLLMVSHTLFQTQLHTHRGCVRHRQQRDTQWLLHTAEKCWISMRLLVLLLLQRSGFDAVNALDFIPMDKFEAKFWKLRQTELEGYNLLYAPLKPRQGDLTGALMSHNMLPHRYTLSSLLRRTGLDVRVAAHAVLCCVQTPSTLTSSASASLPPSAGRWAHRSSCSTSTRRCAHQVQARTTPVRQAHKWWRGQSSLLTTRSCRITFSTQQVRHRTGAAVAYGPWAQLLGWACSQLNDWGCQGHACMHAICVFSEVSPTPACAAVTGDLMYQGLLNGFQGETFGGPAPPKADASIQQLAVGVQQLLDCMVAKGYAISAAVTDVQPGNSSSTAGSAAGGSFSVTVNGPCNLWAVSALKARNSKVINAYDVMVTAAWMRTGGFSAAPEVELLDSGLAQRWTIL